MHHVRRKRRHAHRHVVSALRLWRAVTHPFPCWRVYGLTRSQLQDACLGLDAKHAGQHERELVERRCLPRLLPSWRTVHAGNADVVCTGVHTPDEPFNAFRFVPDGGYDGWLFDQSRHTCPLMPHCMAFIPPEYLAEPMNDKLK
jgi:hypothetical protein